MRKRVYSKRTASLRFFRWSRKAYGAFCSLGRCVVIGQLKKSIADASLPKKVRSLIDDIHYDQYQKEKEEKEDDIPIDFPVRLEISQMFSGVAIATPANRHTYMFYLVKGTSVFM
ncbi:MAG: hypothetical protein RR202_01375 [Bacteroidales bacterium]